MALHVSLHLTFNMKTKIPTYEMDRRGFVRVCSNCGQRNRLLYERLGNAFRCSKCQTALPPVNEPVDVPRAVEFDELIARASIPVLADFWAPWCGPCKLVAPELIKIAADRAGHLIVAKVNTEDLPELGRLFQIHAIPTMVLFEGGFEVARQAGAMPAPRILQFLQQAR